MNNKKVCLLGDFNINLLQYGSNASVNGFLDALTSFNLLPLINRPTRVTENTSTLIDNIFCGGQPSIKSSILISDISDHFPIIASFPLSIKNTKNMNDNTFSRDFGFENMQRFKGDLGATDWSNVLNESDVEKAYDKFLEVLISLYEKNFPLLNKKQKGRRKSPQMPWVSKSLLKCINKKNKLFYKFRSKKTLRAKQKYSRYRNVLTSVLRDAKKLYYYDKFKSVFKDMKGTWKIIRQALNSKKKSQRPSSLLVDGVLTEDNVKMSDAFNQFFSSIGNQLSTNLPASQKKIHDYLSNQVPNSCFFAPVVKEEVIDIVQNLKINKAAGYDGLSNKLLKEVIDVIVSPITHVFNLSIVHGVVPLCMKIAKVVPIFKKGNSHEVGNYRPISLLTGFSKILEKIISVRFVKFLKINNILAPEQFGFREKHTTSHALLHFIDKISSAKDHGLHTVGIFLDYSKAFDTIDHNILLYKLSFYGIRGKALEWFRSYLSDRKQFVFLNGVKSSMQPVTCGVPQGSLLGPLLFLLYINDFPQSSKILSFILFADDSSVFYSDKNPRKLLQTINSELISVNDWIIANRLSLNLVKTNYMLFSNTLASLPDNIIFNDIQITEVLSTKFLGLHIDNKLNWKDHISYLCKLLSRNTGIINSLKSIFPKNVLCMLYSTLILPYINYGILAWGNAANVHLDGLLKVQKRAIRIICGVTTRSHTNILFYENKFLRLHDIFDFNLGCIMYQFSKKELPHALVSLFIRNDQVHSYCTRQASSFHLPLVRTSFRLNTLVYTGPKLWNSLANSLKQSVSLNVFKKKLKIVLLKRYLDQ